MFLIVHQLCQLRDLRRRNQRGITGLETAIVLIAFVVVKPNKSVKEG